MRRRVLACGAAAVLLAPVAAPAQGRTCDVVEAADYVRLTNERGEMVIYFRDPLRMECTGDVRLRADSAVMVQGASAPSIELIGAVVYQDSTRELTADWANYLGTTAQLIARGRVVLTDRVDGSVVRGEELQYRRATPERPLSQVVIRGGRPHATLRERTAPAAAPPEEPAAPVEIRADRLEFLGDSLFLGRGDVEIERATTTGAADSARYDQLAGRMTLLGRAHVQDPRYRLEGERIDALLDGEALREVRSEERARVISEDLTVRSRWLRMSFLEGALERLEAWGPRGATPGDPEDPDGEEAGAGETPAGERALALAEGFRLRADSIDARADAGRLREVRAVGRGYGERRVDSLAVGLAPLVARDWIQGDTIIGHFRDVRPERRVDGPAAEPAPARLPTDTAAAEVPGDAAGEPTDPEDTEVELERIIVIGGSAPALSLYRMDGEDAARPAINFMKAERITLFMDAGEVGRVEADGPIEGVYLDPVTGRPGGGAAAGSRGAAAGSALAGTGP